MAENKYQALELENQLCFPLYAVSKEIIAKYHDYLKDIDLTYTQYVVMMVLWKEKTLNVKALGEKVRLDSGTLTPLLKKLEKKGYITRSRDKDDERNLIISLTESGDALKEKALEIPYKMGKCVPISVEDAKTLYDILYKLLKNL